MDKTEPAELLSRVRRSCGAAVARLLERAIGLAIENDDSARQLGSVLDVDAWRKRADAARAFDRELETVQLAEEIAERAEFVTEFDGRAFVRRRIGADKGVES